jgi:type II secretory pathway predicted ATPase ExeA
VQPPASIEALADPIYEAFYGLKEQPFATSTDPKFLFFSAAHRHAYEQLLTGLKRREALLLLCGETGTGKTTLCRAVLEALGPRTFSAIILNPYMAGAELIRIVLRDFGFISRDEIRRGVLAQADVPQLLDALEGFLKSLMPLDAHAVVIIDEAQSLPAQVLDQIRMLTAYEQDGRRLVQVVLVGQPMLLNTLKTEPLYALNERITRRVMLAPLEPAEVEAYIGHRLGVAGGAETVSFDQDATRLIAELSRGLPRRVNLICDRSLQEGRIEGASVIRADLVKRAARSLTGATPEPPPSPLSAPASDAGSSLMPAETPTPRTVGLSGRNRWIAGGVAGAAVLAASVYGLVARSIVNDDPRTPEVPDITGQWKNAPPIPSAPSAEELAALLDSIKRGAPQVPQLPQFPDDRDKLD